MMPLCRCFLKKEERPLAVDMLQGGSWKIQTQVVDSKPPSQKAYWETKTEPAAVRERKGAGDNPITVRLLQFITLRHVGAVKC